MTHEHYKTPEEAGHEPTTIGARGIMAGLACVVGAMLFSMAMIGGLMGYFAAREAPPPVVGVPGAEVSAPPGTPMLNAKQAAQLEELRARENQMLTEYAWVDREAGVARIPIHRAMEIVAKNPAALAPVPPSAPPNETPPAGNTSP
jgi:hypothetical protein